MRRRDARAINHQCMRLRDDAPTMEAYRILRTNIEFSNTIRPIKKALITSSVLGEGKSTTVATLAQIFAMAGTKTLIVDLDLRRPVQHRIFAVENESGIMNLLSGEISTSEAVKETEVENLYLLNCGRKPPNPADLLSSGVLKEKMSELEEIYDLIIIDSPPVAALADAAIISRIVDTTLLVVAAGKVTYDDVENAVYNLRNAGANILGVIMNNVTKASRGYKYYNYYSYYYE